MISFNPSYDVGTFEESAWPSFYPPYNSSLGWELEKLDAQIEVCKTMMHITKSLTAQVSIMAIRAKAELKRHELIGEFIFKG